MMVCRLPPRLLPTTTGAIRISPAPLNPNSFSWRFLDPLKTANSSPRDFALEMNFSNPGICTQSALIASAGVLTESRNSRPNFLSTPYNLTMVIGS
ncbi:hypothetical protein D3C80_1916820 [compost metagenome]